MYEVYIIKSLIRERYYIGYSHEFEARIVAHNAGNVRSTKGYRPWQLVHKEMFADKISARKRELEIKSYKSGEAFKKLLK
ncbi:endonuclease [Candidatus Giovannonibacteria bacterium RIFCSPLOWO2_02_FULL_43_11b]|uniref:Endonuclease n=1 Tax=Candidatus Giovannonibacteria bacterium RIFCSPHIGHO2_12_FULL_43_15 TaxID=1798341 RepID=A0A1F5WNJ2_9BACT|nr:MAG: endonuclease [Candidatus Giovannonibacteria bacterium RIFCSPHIGHO2_01_FULL_43_100]OGF65954.1 MAG: endonuclease [Candidatus Giovannonibacteria bacterium RIFCSPHIGHO2_02_FULL_43_32]OGF77218.1 MAG: endonuclease [Candidatus Giovannonibacteria bacterium RIFCSPHIGHO2_12_FULL_43_15]OGF78664.1 MAG: endonuclease [Candidatus Giovannonibacteria bacterium RIFCSPLOWO2_01_FULL_43_60]OGF90682.1 MAG: endonuclease [Candidatus Giovannonibacteria bacterium RIFCSPLOWO2_02_FULL_43_11b]OGF91531.1 MAG: endon